MGGTEVHMSNTHMCASFYLLVYFLGFLIFSAQFECPLAYSISDLHRILHGCFSERRQVHGVKPVLIAPQPAYRVRVERETLHEGVRIPAG